jgi:hypothetical protein
VIRGVQLVRDSHNPTVGTDSRLIFDRMQKPRSRRYPQAGQ